MNSSCLIIAGEKSGEEHAMTFLKSLRERRPELDFYGVGGDEMKAAGVEVFYHLRDFSTMGFSSLLTKIPFYFKAMNHLMAQVKMRNTKIAILVDYQDFNLRMAKKLAKEGVEVFYYVAPQAWGWRAGRAQVLSKIVHTLFCLLPFEKTWFQNRGVRQAVSVDHPVFVRFKNELEKSELKSWTSLSKRNQRLLILPGSRYSEVKNHLPLLKEIIIKLKSNHPNLEVGIVKVQHLEDSLYDTIQNQIDYEWHDENLSSALNWGDACLASSGTVTLTCGLFAIPTIVFYKGSLLNEFIFFSLIKYQGYISLTNLVLGEKVLPELLQSQFSKDKIVNEFEKMMSQEHYDLVVEKLSLVKQKLQGEIKDVASFIDHEIGLR